MSNPVALSDPRNAAFCLNCGERSHRPPKTTFLGFRRVSCGQCGRVSTFPLSKNYFNIYVTALVLSVLFSIVTILQGFIPIPGVMFFAAIYGLWKDRQLCREVAAKSPAEMVPDKLTDWLAGKGEEPPPS